MKKEISISQLMNFERCKALYSFNARGGRFQVTTISEIAGEAGHRLAAGDSVESTRIFVQSRLQTLPDAVAADVTAAVMGGAEKFGSQANTMAGPLVQPKNKEVQLSWTDPVTGWTVFAKPDQLYFTGRYGRKVMVIKDSKSGDTVNSKHKKQLFYFALVAVEHYRWTDWVELVVSLPGTGHEECFRYSHLRHHDKLEELRALLRELERVRESNTFEPTPRFGCSRCKFLSRCPQAQAHLALIEAQTELPDDLKPIVLSRSFAMPALPPANAQPNHALVI